MTDRYTPPPRHRERSGALVRFAIVGLLLAGAVWGYATYSGGPGLVPDAPEEQVFADSSLDVATPPATEEVDEPAAAAPEAPAERSAPQSTAPAEPPPPPSTTIGAPPAG